MFKTVPAPRHFSRQMVHVIWEEGGARAHLATLDAVLWRAAQNPKEDRNECGCQDFQKLLYQGARNFALRTLSRRNRSRAWIFEALVRAGIAKPMADRVSREMASRGYADDKTLEGRILQEARGRGRGAHWVRGQLKKQLLSAERVEMLVQMRAREEVASLIAWLNLQGDRLASRPSAAERFKLMQKLMRRGYSLQSVEIALANWQEQSQLDVGDFGN